MISTEKLNGCVVPGIFFRCECDPGFDGPRCEKTSISFQGSKQSYAWYPSISVCNDSTLNIQFTTRSENGLIFYNGPIFPSPMGITGNNNHFPSQKFPHLLPLRITKCRPKTLRNVRVQRNYTVTMIITFPDFVSLELRHGKPVLLMDYGSGVLRIELPTSPDLHNGEPHSVSIRWHPTVSAEDKGLFYLSKCMVKLQKIF